ncbi:MAG: M28 family peptidase [Candidatus Hydrogenedentes bacterium]|nr:M28 family peptidase [Candidatus Hydrogenedentota bacterium]
MSIFIRYLCALLLLASTVGYAQQAGLQPPDIDSMAPQIHPEDIKRHVYYLASDVLAGRLTGAEGERLATDYVAEAFKDLGLRPAGDDGGFFQPFDFTAGVSLAANNKFTVIVGEKTTEFAVDSDWRPLAFSKTGAFDAPIVFAGYGLAAPELDSLSEYDSYVHLDVTDKWVLMLRYIPEDVSTERRLHLTQYAGLRQKAMVARDRGATGVLIVSGPNSAAAQQLVPLNVDASFAGSGLTAISITSAIADALLQPTGKTLKQLQDQLDTGDPVMGFPVPDARVAAFVDIKQERRTGRNVLARLDPPSGPTPSTVVVGAHVDHLGATAGAGSLARDDERARIHSGADDNASGVAGMLEIAQWFVEGERPRPVFENSILFAAWSGEELGLLGSAHFVRELAEELNVDTLSPAILAYVNLDMIGRMRKNVVIGGVGSSSIWAEEIPKWNEGIDVPIVTQNDSYLPTDCTSFFVRGVPFINAFTGAHEDYHSPRDTADKVNCEGAAKISKFLANVTRGLAERTKPPDYIGQAKPKDGGTSTGLRAYLGTIPDYAQPDVAGLPLSGVAEGGPAAMAGLKSGDVIIELGGKKVENIYDYTYAIEALKIGAPVKVVVVRKGERHEFEITPSARE